IDRENNRIFTSGRNKLLAVLDANSGKVIQTLPIGGGVDACVFDKADHLIFTSNGEGNITIIKAQSPDEYKVLENIPTAQGARTMAFDEKTRRIYSLAAIPENSAPENNTKNAIKTFSVLVIDRK
ncbi:MAG: YncE family protein, partial [Methanococcaceae archaeon]